MTKEITIYIIKNANNPICYKLRFKLLLKTEYLTLWKYKEIPIHIFKKLTVMLLIKPFHFVFKYLSFRNFLTFSLKHGKA